MQKKSFHSLALSLRNKNKEAVGLQVQHLQVYFWSLILIADTNTQLSMNKRLQMLPCFAYFPIHFYRNKTVLRFSWSLRDFWASSGGKWKAKQNQVNIWLWTSLGVYWKSSHSWILFSWVQHLGREYNILIWIWFPICH